MKKCVVSLILLLSSSSWAAPMPQTPHAVKLSDAVVREMLPGADATAGYFTLTNHSATPISLSWVGSDDFERVEIHQHVMNGQMMKMQQVKEAIVIEPQQSLEFQPGGYHLMLFKPKQKVKKGATLALTFNFKQLPPLTAAATVVSVLDQQKSQQQHSHH